MALVASLRFNTVREADTADGWTLSLGQESAVPVTTYYATYTLAEAAMKAAFNADADTNAYFTSVGEASVLASNAAAVTAATAAAKTAEGL